MDGHQVERNNMVGRGTGRRMEVLAVWVFICICLLFPGDGACAGDTGSMVSRHTFAIGVGGCHFDNEEQGSDQHRGPEWDGWMYGVVGNYSYHHKIMISADVDCSTGGLDYTGGTTTLSAGGQSQEEFTKKDADSNTVELRGLLGYDFVLGEKHLVTPFLGMGYRYWSEDRGGVGGYQREVTYWYSPLGVRTCSPLSDKWTWGINLEYDLFWDGEVDSDISGMPTFHYNSGYGTRFSLHLRRELTKNVALSFEPYITYWDIDASDPELFALPEESDPEFYTVFPFIEPENSTTSYGLRVSLEF
jgi:hypothetical protein